MPQNQPTVQIITIIQEYQKPYKCKLFVLLETIIICKQL